MLKPKVPRPIQMNNWRGEKRVVETGTVKSNLGHAELTTEEGASVMDG